MVVVDELAVEINGDAVTVQFSGEEELVLFLPLSGEVLRCSTVSWRNLNDTKSSSTLNLNEQSTNYLRRELNKLGAVIA